MLQNMCKWAFWLFFLFLDYAQSGDLRLLCHCLYDLIFILHCILFIKVEEGGIFL